MACVVPPQGVIAVHTTSGYHTGATEVETGMKILVMGSGAVGGYFGGVLQRAGNDVVFIARSSHREAIIQSGMNIQSNAAGTFVVQAPALERPDGTWKADLILYCVKSYDNETAVPLIGPAVGDNTSILSLQNGMGSGDLLAAAYGWDKVLLGVTHIDSTRKAPGTVSEFGLVAPDLIFGEEDGSRSARALELEKTFDVEGIDAILSDNIAKELWNKYIYICGLSGSTCITRSTFDQVVGTPATLEFVRTIMQEAYAVGRARGVDIAEDYVDTTADYFVSIKGGNTSSMYTDLMRGSPIEIDVLNGGIARMGAELGVATPANEFIATCLSLYHNNAMEARGS
jgi:2-dehydropantoate 2-reductase